MTSAIAAVVEPAITHLDRHFIDGAWLTSDEGGWFDVVSPDNEAVVARVARAGRIDADKAVAAARRAFDEGPWPSMSVSARAGLLANLFERLRQREGELSRCWSLQMGGLQRLAPSMAANGTANFSHTLKVAEQFPFELRTTSHAAAAAMIVQEPVGVVLAIVPWNSPYALMTSKIAPALLAGCTVVMKPSPETPLEAYIIAECAEAAGLPKGVLNLLTADREVAEHLVGNSGIDKVSFTGSTLAGRRIAERCAPRIGRYTLELGGKSAAIVLDDFGVDEAAALLTQAITMMSGQICSMLSRALVPRHREQALASAIAARMKAIAVGHSDDPAADMGPLASRRQLERVERYIRRGIEEGATLVTGGNRPGHISHGCFIEPTLFAQVDNSMTIAQEEIFGPVLSLIPYDDVEDAIRLANASIYGLGGAVFTHDNEAAYRIARRIRTGKFAQNGMKGDSTLPSGGFKQSGVGREGGADGLRGYLETKTLFLCGYPQPPISDLNPFKSGAFD